MPNQHCPGNASSLVGLRLVQGSGFWVRVLRALPRCLPWFLGCSAEIPYCRDVIYASYSLLLIQNFHFFQLGQGGNQAFWLVSVDYWVVSLGASHVPALPAGLLVAVGRCCWQVFSNNFPLQLVFCREGWPVTAGRFWKCSGKQACQGWRHVG